MFVLISCIKSGLMPDDFPRIPFLLLSEFLYGLLVFMLQLFRHLVSSRFEMGFRAQDAEGGRELICCKFVYKFLIFFRTLRCNFVI